MIKLSKVALSLAAITALNGCFEVEDNNNNDDVVAALEAQNAILQEQVTTVTVEKTPITLFGNVVDAATGNPVSDATVTVKVGAEWRPAMSVTGEFSVENLPVNTDVVVLVQSSTGAFMDRAFFGKTTNVDQGQVASQSMGDLNVSEAIVKTYAILNAENSEPFAGLVFNYNTASVFSSGYTFSGLNNYRIESSYDQATGLYSIALPKDLNFNLTASGDIDGDGIIDFTPENNSFWYGGKINLNASSALQLETMYVNETEAYQPVELRIAVIDDLGDKIDGVEFFASDTYLGRLETSYDADTEEYVFNYQTSSRVDLNMPSFTTSDDVNYRSASLVLTWSSENALSVSDYGFRNNLSGSIDVVDGVASIIVQPIEQSTPSDYVSLVSSVIDENNNFSLNQFYQSPIGLVEGSVSMIERNVFTVIKGNDSDNDLVPEGTTQIGYASEDIAVTSTLSHNDTFLTVTPNANLDAGDYRYDVNDLVNRETGNIFSSGNNYINFTVAPQSSEIAPFDINDVRLDNNNGTTNGSQIVATNTAGLPNTSTNNSRGSNLYFPKSILSLDYFEMRLVSYVRNGVTQNYDREINVVNGESVYVGRRNVVNLAENEDIEAIPNYYSASADTQTSLSEGEWYYYSSVGAYTADNTGSSVNTATFSYIYRVAGQDNVVEGTITLPVL